MNSATIVLKNTLRFHISEDPKKIVRNKLITTSVGIIVGNPGYYEFIPSQMKRIFDKPCHFAPTPGRAINKLLNEKCKTYRDDDKPIPLADVMNFVPSIINDYLSAHPNPTSGIV